MIWRCAQGVTQNFSSTNFDLHRNEAVGSLYSTRSGNLKLSSFLGIGRFLGLFRRIYYPCTYIALGGRGGGGGDSHVTRREMFGVNSKENLQKIPARSLRRLLHFFLLFIKHVSMLLTSLKPVL